MSGLYFLPVVLVLSAICIWDGSRAAIWMAVITLLLNAALIYFEFKFSSPGKGWFVGRSCNGVRVDGSSTHETNLPGSSVEERVHILSQAELLGFPRRVSIQEVLKRPSDGVNPTTDSAGPSAPAWNINAVPL